MASESPNVRRFATLRLADVPLVGGKNASLGELYAELGGAGVRVPNGFALTADAYRDALTAAGAWPRLHALLDGLDVTDLALLAQRAHQARQIVYDATGTDDLSTAIADSYRKLEEEYGDNVAVAVRSSATAEDLPTASFAGQHESYLNISGANDLFEACRLCFASLFTDRAIVYRVNNGFDHFKVCAVGRRDEDGALGHGLERRDLHARHRVRLSRCRVHHWRLRSRRECRAGQGRSRRVLCPQADLPAVVIAPCCDARWVRSSSPCGWPRAMLASSTRDQVMTEEARSQFCIDDADVLTLADYAIRIEQHYSAQAGHPVPMDIEWAKDAEDGRLYIVQARPETVASQRAGDAFESYALTGEGRVLVSGKAVGEKIGVGTVRVIDRRRGPEGFPARRSAWWPASQARTGSR